MDETYIRVKGAWRSLYRAVDKYGQTIDFLLTENRDKEAALRFLKKAIRRHGVPEMLTIDGSDANDAAIKSYNQEYGTTIIIQQVKYLNNVVAQDHRAGKQVPRPMLGFQSFDAAQCPLVGIELMHMLRQGQLADGVEQGLTPAEQFYALASYSPRLPEPTHPQSSTHEKMRQNPNGVPIMSAMRPVTSWWAAPLWGVGRKTLFSSS